MVKIFDPNGREITVGALVQGGGRIVGITEPEGDYNSYGRAVMYGPYVKVLYAINRVEMEDQFLCSPQDYNYETFVCDDVVLS